MDDVKKAVERDFFDAGISAMFMYLWLLMMNFYITSIYHVMTLTSR
jgi:hypothetical protein